MWRAAAYGEICEVLIEAHWNVQSAGGLDLAGTNGDLARSLNRSLKDMCKAATSGKAVR
jgi:hypothetical protein